MPAITASRWVEKSVRLHGSRIVVGEKRGKERWIQSGTFTTRGVCHSSVPIDGAPLLRYAQGSMFSRRVIAGK